jgi:hypothetical protein
VPKRFSPRTTTVSDVADHVDRFNAVLGPELVSALTAEQVASWASSLPTSRSA